MVGVGQRVASRAGLVRPEPNLALAAERPSRPARSSCGRLTAADPEVRRRQGVVPFQRGAQSTSKQVGEIPASYSQGSGTIVSGTAAN
jgi:hypothetical protein